MSGAYVPPKYVPENETEHLEDSSITDSQVRHLLARGTLQSSTVNAQQPQHPYHWTSGICACCDDMPVCCLGCWCPCVLFGRNVEMLTDKPWPGPCFMHCVLWGTVTALCCLFAQSPIGILASCVPGYASGYRQTLRMKYNLEDAPCGDFMTHLCCHTCANCQEHREMRERSTAVGLPVVVPPYHQSMGVPNSP